VAKSGQLEASIGVLLPQFASRAPVFAHSAQVRWPVYTMAVGSSVAAILQVNISRWNFVVAVSERRDGEVWCLLWYAASTPHKTRTTIQKLTQGESAQRQQNPGSGKPISHG